MTPANPLMSHFLGILSRPKTMSAAPGRPRIDPEGGSRAPMGSRGLPRRNRGYGGGVFEGGEGGAGKGGGGGLYGNAGGRFAERE